VNFATTWQLAHSRQDRNYRARADNLRRDSGNAAKKWLLGLTLLVATSPKSTLQVPPGIREIDRLEGTRLGEQVIQGMVFILEEEGRDTL